MKAAPGSRRFSGDDVLPAVLALVAVVVGVVSFSFFLFPHAVQVGFDEGYEAAGVERLIDGRGLPYVDAVSIRGPFLYWALAVVQLLTGRFQWVGTRVLSVLCCGTTSAMGFLAGWAAGWPLAGAIAAAMNVFVVATYYDPGGGAGVHAEPVAIAFIATALFLTSYGLYRARTARARVVWLVAGGAVVGITGLTKQTLGVCALPMLFWVLAHGHLREAEASGDGRARWRPLLSQWVLPFAAGGVGMLLLVLLRYALAGELGTFFYWSIGVGSQIYMAPYKGRVAKLVAAWFIDQPWALLGTVLALTVATGAALGRVKGRSPRAILLGFGETAFETNVGLTGIALMLAAAAPLRIWPHYFFPVWLFFGMIIGLLIERYAVRGAATPRAAQAAVVLIFGAMLVVSGVNHLSQLYQQRLAGGWRNPRPDAVCAEIDRIAGPGRDEIFVWGLAGDLYITCRRRCASMHTHTTLLVGIAPPFWNEPNPSRIPAGTREKLLAELTARPPKVIVDHAISIPGTAMVDIPMYARFLNERYCRIAVMPRGGRTLTLYGRKDLLACAERSP